MKIAYATAATLLLAGVSLVLTASGGSIATVLWAVAVGGLSVLFVRMIEDQIEVRGEAAPLLMAGSAMVLAWVSRWIWMGRPDREAVWVDAAAAFVALGAAWTTDAVAASRTARVCFICKTRIAERPIVCPRCHQAICSQPSCWIARHVRCRSCDERDVVVFPMQDEAWWKTRLGPRVMTGTCGSCFEEARATDLRACGECSWPMCKRCWDYHNGRCVRCEWTVPSLPESLQRILVGAGAPPGAESRRPV